MTLTSCSSGKVVINNSETNSNHPDAEPHKIKKPRNIIFLIGDGMGLSQVTAGMFSNDNHLELERCTIVGIHKPYSANDLITDSASGATAFSIGKKTINAYLGLDSTGASHTTIMEDVSKIGMNTGLIVTSTIVHATPAAFYAHQKSRDDYEDIARDMVNSDFNLLIGGGKKYFDRRTKDTLNLITQLKSRDFFVSDYFENNLNEMTFPKVKKFCFFTADGDPLPVSMGRNYLPVATQKGIQFLKNNSDKGFFLMVEGSQIDWGGHNNDANYIISEMLDFDKAIKQALDFSEADQNTLVVITADHETGGFAINSGKKFGDLNTGFTTKKHTADLIPVYAFGPGAEMFSGIYENTEIYNKMKKLIME
jgi:alkaline phosphatase